MSNKYYTTFSPDIGSNIYANTEIINDAYEVTVRRPDNRPNCPVCDSKIIHINEKRKRRYKDVPYNHKPVYITVHYHRYKCQNCNKKFIPPFDEVIRNRTHSNRLIRHVLEGFRRVKSGVENAWDSQVSKSTSWRYFEMIEVSENAEGTTRIHLDEFKGNADGEKYHLSIINQDGELLTVLPTRKIKAIREYLMGINTNKIDYVVVDLFKSFRKVLRDIFTVDKIIVDKYHFIRQVTWALRDKRISLYNTNEEEYKDYKRYWRLFVMNPNRLTDKQISRLEELLSKDKILKELHEFYKNFSAFVNNLVVSSDKKERYETLLDQLEAIEGVEASGLYDTLRRWSKEIVNAVETGYSNGVLEGLNNKTKVIKRVSYGIRTFNRLKTLMHLRLKSTATITIDITKKTSIKAVG